MPRPRKSEPRADIHVVVDESTRTKLQIIIQGRWGDNPPPGAMARVLTGLINAEYDQLLVIGARRHLAASRNVSER